MSQPRRTLSVAPPTASLFDGCAPGASLTWGILPCGELARDEHAGGGSQLPLLANSPHPAGKLAGFLLPTEHCEQKVTLCYQ